MYRDMIKGCGEGWKKYKTYLQSSYADNIPFFPFFILLIYKKKKRKNIHNGAEKKKI